MRPAVAQVRYRAAIAAAAVPFGLLELRAQQTLEDAFIRLTKGAE